jgi:hypothetical protein
MVSARRLMWLILFGIIIPAVVLMILGTFIAFRTGTDTRGEFTTTTYMNLWGTPMHGVTTHTSGMRMEGPMSPSGQLHGAWKVTDGQGKAYLWYWYGDRVTEGEWHRNAR